jgi:arylsulfatase/uncharacterized sulfatase
MLKKFYSVLLAFASITAFAAPPPNIVLILVDDAGLMDFGGYGGEARTPHIDEIADAGVRFSNYHTSPLCAPSRAMLLTGVDNHMTGIATIPEVLTEEQSMHPGYSMHFVDGIRTVADKLRDSGYRTYMTGKWHLGSGEGELPGAHGFDRSFVLDASGADNWEQKSYMPYYDHAPWFEDGEPADLPEDFYSSEFIVDKMLEYLETGDQGAPFFSYLAFQAIHIPVQAPVEFTDRYEGVYSEGWDRLRQQRFETAKRNGLVEGDGAAPQLHQSLRSWDSLSGDEKRWFERAMMVNAGMLEAMDFHIGRLISQLKQQGQFSNTVFIVTSDNGPEFGFPGSSALFQFWMGANGYNTDIEHLGEKGSLVAIGPEWASAASTPGSLFKFYASEGGTRVPLIVSGPGVARVAGFKRAMVQVTDLTPTILSMANVDPDVRHEGTPMTGRSLAGLLSGEVTSVYPDDQPIGMEVSGNASLIKGEYKLTRNTLPHGDGRWRLYRLREDPAELVDLSDELPEIKAALLADYEVYANTVGVLPTNLDFDVGAQVGRNTIARVLQQNAAFLVGLMIAFLLLALLIVVAVRKQLRSGGSL